jgi:two-component system, LytTR family, response regulator
MTNKVNVAIIDDEKYVLDQMVDLFKDIPEANLKCVTSNLSELLTSLNDTDIDVVILDISMPNIDGFQVANYLRTNYPSLKIIFMSAHTEYALRGYDFYPEDYLVKPINYFRLRQTLKKIKESTRTKLNSKLGIRCEGSLKLIDVGKIQYIEKRGRKTRIYLEDGQIINCNERLSVLEQILESRGFYRPHQSYIVPLDKIEEIIPDNYMKSYNIRIRNCCTLINLSRSKYQELKKYLHELEI